MLRQISRRSGDSGDAKPTLPDAEMISSAPLAPSCPGRGMVRGRNKQGSALKPSTTSLSLGISTIQCSGTERAPAGDAGPE